jgi:hypothetical protein
VQRNKKVRDSFLSDQSGKAEEPKPGEEESIVDKLAMPPAEIDFEPDGSNESLDVAVSRSPNDQRVEFVDAALTRRAKFRASGRNRMLGPCRQHTVRRRFLSRPKR